MKRTPLRRKTPHKRGKRLNNMSEKRKSELAERRHVREEVHARDGGCVAIHLVPQVKCWGPLDVDEIKPKGIGGDWLDPDNCQVLCRAHHDWKHQNILEAKELGLFRGTEAGD